MKKFTFKDIIILGLFNFALYAGAGNIILPPYVGLMAGDNVWISALGFFLTGVGLPVFATFAMARINGSLKQLILPLGSILGFAVIIVCYLYTGPFVAIPRTATVAYDLGFRAFNPPAFFERVFYFLFFACIILAAISPKKLFEIVGKILTPIKVFVLLVLCATIFFVPDHGAHVAKGIYETAPFSEGLVQGYLTMDTFGSLVFCMILVNAVKDRGVTDEKRAIRYVVLSGCIAGFMLILIYLCLFRLGQLSASVAGDATNGAQLLSHYISAIFGRAGEILVCVVITIACMVTAIGLSASFGIFFSELTSIPYKLLVILSGLIAMLIANLGLTQLLQYSIPALQAVYPVFILLLCISFFQKYMKHPLMIGLPTAFCAFLFGLADAFSSLKIADHFTSLIEKLPLSALGLAWIFPCFLIFLIMFAIDQIFCKKTIIQ